jgi:single-strand DNA-binding protein
MLNNVTMIGRITKNPELRVTPGGNSVVNFNLAIDRGFDKEKNDADYVPVVCWGPIAENLSKYITQGRLLSVQGSIRTRDYVNNEGKKVYVVEVLASDIRYLEPKSKTQDSATKNEVSQETEENPFLQSADQYI